MIIGNGLIGSAFSLSSESPQNGYVIFASGVSDSKDNTTKNFKRERDLILKTLSETEPLKFIYFSSILAGVSNNDYYNHKVEMEDLIKNNSNNYIIFKVPQIVGFNGNKNNLINYLITTIKNHGEVIVYDNTYRALVCINDVIRIVNYCKTRVKNETIYFSHIEKSIVTHIVDKISDRLNIIPNIIVSTKHNSDNWEIDNSPIIDEAINFYGIDRVNYIDKIITKYIK